FRIALLDRGLQPLSKGLIWRVVAQKPASHSAIKSRRNTSIKSTRAYYTRVRSSPDSGTKADIAGGRRSDMCGRLRGGKENLTWRRLGSVQPCVRPLSAVHMTAGHNALRGSGPGQNLAFKMRWH